MGVEVRRIETEVAETGLGQDNRTDVTYELGFATPSGGWVKFVSVPEATVINAEANAAQADQPPTQPADLSPTEPADAGSTIPPAPAAAPAATGDQTGDTGDQQTGETTGETGADTGQATA